MSLGHYITVPGCSHMGNGLSLNGLCAESFVSNAAETRVDRTYLHHWDAAVSLTLESSLRLAQMG